MSDTRRLAVELHEIRQLALGHATNPQFGNSSVDGEGLSFRDGDGNEIGRIGGGENGMEVEYTYGPKPLMPSTPIVTADANLLLVQWDGQWAGGNEDGDAVADPDLASQAGLDRVEVHVSMEPTFVPDPILSFAGVLPITPEGGAHTVGPLAEAGDYYVVLMARGKDGQYSAPSQRVHVVTTVGLMENELFELALRADEARESADGKNTVHYGEEPTPPDGGFAEGDLWFDTTEDPETGVRSNTPHLWDPSANNGEGGWVSAEDGRVQAIQDAQESLREDVENIVVDANGNATFWLPEEPDETTEPTPKTGDIWFNTSDGNKLHRFDGQGWVPASDSRFQTIQDAYDDLESDVDSVRASVDGKNRITQSVDTPPTQYDGSVGDRWERMSSMGSGGSLVSNWRWNGDVWVSTIISDAVLGNVDAAKIGTGYLSADRIEAGSITADKVLVGNTNLVPDPGFITGNEGWTPFGFGVSVHRDPTGGVGGTPALVIDDAVGQMGVYGGLNHERHRIPVEPGATYLVRARVLSSVPIGQDGARIYVRLYRPGDASGDYKWASPNRVGPDGTITADTWGIIEGQFRIPEDYSYMSLGLFKQPVLGAAEVRWSIPSVSLASGATLIEDGAITTDKIQAGAITAESGIIGSLDAGTITVGEMNGARIEAGTVTADKLLVGSLEELAPSPAVYGADWELEGGASFFGWVSAYDGVGLRLPSGSRALGPYRSTNPGRSVQAEAWVGRYGGLTGDVDLDIRLYFYDRDRAYMTSLLAATGLGAVSGSAVAPDRAVYVRIGLLPTASFGGGWLSVRDMSGRPQVGATLIENGAITTEKIAVGAITAESGIIGSLDAGVITTGELRGELIRAQSIAGESLAVDAIDGKTITGATVRTSSAGARVEMNSSGLFVKNSVGANTVSMTNGALTMIGGTITGGTIRTHTSGARVQLDTGGLKAWNPSNEETFSVDANTGMVESRGALYTGAPGTVRAALAPGLFDNVTITDPADGSAAPAVGAGILLGEDFARGSQIYHAKSTVFGKEFDSLTILGPSASSSRESIVFARGMIDTTAVAAGGIMYSQIRTQNHNSYMFTKSTNVSTQIGASQSRAFLYANTGSTRVASILVGNANAVPKNAIEIKASGGIVLDSGGDLSMYMGRWVAPNINSGNGTDLIVTSSNFIGKKSSSRRYKIAEEPIGHTLPGVEDALLDMEVKTWFDRRGSERLAEAETEKANGIVPLDDLKDVDPLRRIPGVVAEDLDAAGLGMFVVYNDDGSPESVMYDRLGVALVPAVKSLRDRVNELERIMGEMANA